MPRKTRGKGREKSAVAISLTQDLENPAAENPDAGKEHDEPSTVEGCALPSTEIPRPDDPVIESYFDVEKNRNVLQQKLRKTQTDLTEDQEHAMVECLSAHPILYNKKLKGYKETQKKEYLWREQTNLLGKDVDVIKTWDSSIPTRYRRLKKTRSGAPDEELTERDNWIMREFGFLQPHIIEVKKRTAVSKTAKLVLTTTEETMTSHTADAPVDTGGTGAFSIDAFDDSTTTISTSTGVPSTSTYSRASRTQNRSSDDAILADLASSREQLVNLQRELLGRNKNTPEPNERDSFLDWVKQAVAGFIRLFGAASKLTYNNWSAATLTCRSSSNNSSSLTFPQTRIVIPVLYNGSLIPHTGHPKSSTQRLCGDLRNALGCISSSFSSKTSKRVSLPLVDRHKFGKK